MGLTVAVMPLRQPRSSMPPGARPPAAGPRSAALCLGPPPPSLYAALAGRAESPHRQRILTAGAAPPLASFEAEEAAAPGLLSLVSDLASSTAASLLGTARSYVPNPAASVRRSLLGGLRRSRGGGGSAASVASSAGGSTADLQAAGQGRAARQERIPGEPAKPQAAVWDEKRSVSQMALSPWWVVAAAAVWLCCSGRLLAARQPCASLAGGCALCSHSPPHPARAPAVGAGRRAATAWGGCCWWMRPPRWRCAC